MIFDHIKNYEKYKCLGEDVYQMLKFFAETDFSEMSKGRVAVDGEDAYYMVTEVTTFPADGKQFEAHRKYLDIQFMFKGEEKIPYAEVSTLQQVTEYDEAKDRYFCTGHPQGVSTLTNGMFAIYYPQDAHMPSIVVDKPMQVKKIVGKIKL